MQESAQLPEVNSDVLFTLSEISAQQKPWKTILDDIFAYSHKYIIIDNLAIYLTDIKSQRLEILYARALGRGKSAEADVSWGENIAAQVIQKNQPFFNEPENFTKEDRLNQPFSLGIPFTLFDQLIGAIVFIRFGGPQFSSVDQSFAKFISRQLNMALQTKTLQEYWTKLKKQSNETELQKNFINNISHELRNPLGFIKGYTTTLLREDTQWDAVTQTDFLRIIDRETNHLQELIDNLLDSSRLASGQMKFDSQILRLDALIRDEVNRTLVNHPEVVFHLDFDPDLHPINGDPDRLAQVINNLITNSMKYAPGAEIFITVHQLENEVSIDFRDTGPGIPDKYLDKIFDRFFRDPEQSVKIHGSGLGLSICKEIVERHSGQITSSNPPGWGLSFLIKLPANPNFMSSLSGGK